MIYKDTHYCQITPVPPTSFPVLPGSPHTPCANHNTCSFFFLTFYTRKNVNSLRYADDTTLLAQSEDKLKNRLMRVQEESEKAGLILKIQKNKVMVSSPITSWQIGGERGKKDRFLFSWDPKSLQIVTVVMKLKDTCSLEGKL